MATNYLWFGTNLLEEFDDDGTTIVSYDVEPDPYGNVISQTRSGETSHFLYDPQGSTTEVIDDDGNVTDTRRYTAFGETVEATGVTLFPFQYVGRNGYYYDANRVNYYVRRRDYDNIRGRWECVDLLGVSSDNINVYMYAENTPLVIIDPSGNVGFFLRINLQLPKLRVGIRPCQRGPFMGPPRPFYPDEPKPQINEKPTEPTRGDRIDRKRRPYGDCSQSRHDQLKAAVDKACKDTGAPTISCEPYLNSLWLCSTLRDYANRWKKCLDARTKREWECFRGGDSIHVFEMGRAAYHMSLCWWRYRQKRCGETPGAYDDFNNNYEA